MMGPRGQRAFIQLVCCHVKYAYPKVSEQVLANVTTRLGCDGFALQQTQGCIVELALSYKQSMSYSSVRQQLRPTMSK